MAEQDRLGHDVLGQDLRAGLDHHDRVARAGDDQVELGLLELAGGRVDDELAVDPADAHGADRAVERDLADRQRGRRGDRAEDVGVVLLVRREDRDHELDVVLVALGEERPDRAVRQAGGQDRGLRRARLALDEAARDLARGVHPLLEVDREREEVEAGAGLGAVGGAEHHGVAVADGDGAAGEAGELAGLDGQRATAELRLECLRHGDWILLGPWRRSDLRAAGRSARRASDAIGPRDRPEVRERRSLAAEPQPSDDGAVARVVLLDQIRKKAAALADELEEAAARMVVLREAAEMVGQPLDPLRQERDLDLRRSGVTVLDGEPGDDLLLLLPARAALGPPTRTLLRRPSLQ